MAKTIRLIAIGSALVTGATVTILLPSANAADEKTPQQIMRMCNRTAVLNGKQQDVRDFGGGFADGFESTSCDYRETNFETFLGEPEKVTVDFPNCEPNSTDPVEVKLSYSAEVRQGEGRYEFTQRGAAGSLFGLLNGAWLKHTGTMTLELNGASLSDTETRQVPPGKVLALQFQPKRQRMTGEWKVFVKGNDAAVGQPPREDKVYFAKEEVEGPFLLKSPAGSDARVPEGEISPILTDCPGGARAPKENDPAESPPAESPPQKRPPQKVPECPISPQNATEPPATEPPATEPPATPPVCGDDVDLP